MKNEIQKTESPLQSAAALVQADGNMDVEKLGKLLEMQERWDATQAKKAFVVAMAAFKENPPEILKDKHVSHPTKTGGQKEYSHATLHNVTTTIQSELSKHGLTASWETGQENGNIKVICKIRHIMGHGEETYLSAPPDSSGGKNPIQSIGSTITYLQRYTLLALAGLATYDQDDDGAGADKKPEIPKLTAANKKALAAIYAKLQESLSDDNVVDEDKVATIFFAQNGAYPAQVARAGAAASWLIGLKQESTWVKLTKEAADKIPEPDPSIVE